MGSRRSAELPPLLADLARALAASGLPYMLIGGQAVLVHGRPRLTEDIDVTLAAAPDRLGDVLALCDGLGLTPLPREPERFVRETFVLPCRDHGTGFRVDFIFSTTPYERQAIDRAVRVTVEGVEVRVAAVEDLILHKLFAARARDLEDAESVVRRKGRELDWGYLERWTAEFSRLPGREALLDQLQRLRAGAG